MNRLYEPLRQQEHQRLARERRLEQWRQGLRLVLVAVGCLFVLAIAGVM